jgi:hypothetical protein
MRSAGSRPSPACDEPSCAVVEKVDWSLTFAAAAYTLSRLSKLLACEAYDGTPPRRREAIHWPLTHRRDGCVGQRLFDLVTFECRIA